MRSHFSSWPNQLFHAKDTFRCKGPNFGPLHLDITQKKPFKFSGLTQMEGSAFQTSPSWYYASKRKILRTYSDARVRISDLSILILRKKNLKFSGLTQMEGSEFRTYPSWYYARKLKILRTYSDARVRISDLPIMILRRKNLKFSGLIQLKGSEFRTSPSWYYARENQSKFSGIIQMEGS